MRLVAGRAGAALRDSKKGRAMVTPAPFKNWRLEGEDLGFMGLVKDESHGRVFKPRRREGSKFFQGLVEDMVHELQQRGIAVSLIK